MSAASAFNAFSACGRSPRAHCSSAVFNAARSLQISPARVVEMCASAAPAASACPAPAKPVATSSHASGASGDAGCRDSIWPHAAWASAQFPRAASIRANSNSAAGAGA